MAVLILVVMDDPLREQVATSLNFREPLTFILLKYLQRASKSSTL